MNNASLAIWHSHEIVPLLSKGNKVVPCINFAGIKSNFRVKIRDNVSFLASIIQGVSGHLAGWFLIIFPDFIGVSLLGIRPPSNKWARQRRYSHTYSKLRYSKNIRNCCLLTVLLHALLGRTGCEILSFLSNKVNGQGLKVSPFKSQSNQGS